MLYKDDSDNFVYDSDDTTEIYYVGNVPGKKIGDVVYFRWTDGLFYKRDLFTGKETPIDFLNDMHLSMNTGVGFMDDFIAVEVISDNTYLVNMFDFYGYDGTKKESDYKKQIDEYIFSLIYTNLKDIELSVRRYVKLNENEKKTGIKKPVLNGRLTLSEIEKLYLTLKEQQLIRQATGNNFEKCLLSVKDSGVEDSVAAFHNIIKALRNCTISMYPSVFHESPGLKAFFELSDTMEKTQFAQVISDYEALESALLMQIEKSFS